MNKMLLAVDIGNSTIGICLFSNPADSRRLFAKKIPSHPVQTAETYTRIISGLIKNMPVRPSNHSPAIDAIVSSVVPSLNRPVIKAVRNLCGKSPLIVNHKLNGGLVFDMPHPEKTGADRIANAVAAFYCFKKPAAVVDFGSATTITVVGGRLNLLGGAILPGLQLMREALRNKTAKLPLAPLRKPAEALGKNTASSINSGIIFGTAGAVELIIKNMEKETGFKLKLLLTGGYAEFISPFIARSHILMPDLTSQGLRLIYLKNIRRQKFRGCKGI